MAEIEIQVFELVDGLQEAAARHAIEVLQATADGRDIRIALSGGSTPKRFHELLAEAEGIDWSRVHVYWGDERMVPPEDEQSNFRMAKETLLDKVPIPAIQIHRIRGELDPGEAADEYERALRESFGVEPPDLPQFDLMILGVGPDGHTASLFPGTAALDERERWVVANHVPQQQQSWRVTLTYPVLNAAQLTLVLANGANKADEIGKIFDPNAPDKPPAAYVQPDGQMIWLLDEAAAANLKR
jgi:6-phosphogluconolactonase